MVVEQFKEGQHGVGEAAVHSPRINDIRPLFQGLPVNLIGAGVLAYRRRIAGLA